MVIELNILSDLYSKPDKQGKQKLLKKNIESRMIVNTTDIRYVEEIINPKGNIIKNQCSIKLDGEVFRIKHSLEEIKEYIGHTDNRRSIGFNK